MSVITGRRDDADRGFEWGRRRIGSNSGVLIKD
jgi:hypothetical protein